MSEELSMKMDRTVRLTFDRFFASDITGRARAFGSLVTAGVRPAAAGALTGMEIADSDVMPQRETQPPVA